MVCRRLLQSTHQLDGQMLLTPQGKACAQYAGRRGSRAWPPGFLLGSPAELLAMEGSAEPGRVRGTAGCRRRQPLHRELENEGSRDVSGQPPVAPWAVSRYTVWSSS